MLRAIAVGAFAPAAANSAGVTETEASAHGLLSLAVVPLSLIEIVSGAATCWGVGAFLRRTARPMTIDMYSVDRHLRDRGGETVWRERSTRIAAELDGMRVVRVGLIGREVHATNPTTGAKCVLMWQRGQTPLRWWRKAAQDFIRGYRSAGR